MIVFLNGKLLPEAEAMVPLNDRGWLLGDGLFETVRVANGKLFRWDSHWERLRLGLEFLKITPPYASKDLQTAAAELLDQNQLTEAILRVTVTRGRGTRGYSPKNAGPPTIAITLSPLPSKPAGEPLSCRLATSSFRIPAGDALSSFKTTSKLLNVLARAEAEERGADEALLLNTDGEAAETAGGNLFWIDQNAVCTVPDGGILPGITRGVVLEICASLGLPTRELRIRPEQLGRMSGLFMTNSAQGIIPISSLDARPLDPSPLVNQIAEAYLKVLRQESV